MDNIMEKFWKRWIEADHMNRLKVIERMVEKRGFENIMKTDNTRSPPRGIRGTEKFNHKHLALVLNGYFEDLAYVVDAKVAKESNKEITRLKEEIAKTNKLFKKLEGVVRGDLQ